MGSPATFTPTNYAVSVSPQQLIQSALFEAGILAAGDVLSAEDGVWGLEKLQRLLDSFNAQQDIIYNRVFQQFTLTANHAPHTMGPGGDFNVPIRPVRIVGAAFILNSTSSNPVDSPQIRIRDHAWWMANPLKSLANSIVTDLYYQPASPLGNLNFYPICNIANPVRLEFWDSLAQAVDLTTPLGFVQGYWDAIVLTLAKWLCPSYNKEPSQTLLNMQRDAIEVITGNNNAPPLIDTNSGGMAGTTRDGRPDFNFLTGLRE